jgi:hypothetical protein
MIHLAQTALFDQTLSEGEREELAEQPRWLLRLYHRGSSIHYSIHQ